MKALLNHEATLVTFVALIYLVCFVGMAWDMKWWPFRGRRKS